MIESLSRRLQSAIAIGWIALVWITIFAIAIGLAWFVMAAIAHAQDSDTRWVYRTIRRHYVSCDTWNGECYRAWRYVRVRVRSYAYYYPEREPTRVYGYSRREDDGWERRDASSERGINCKGTHVRVVGGLHLTKEGALNDAIRQWQSTVRYDAGEKFMDVENARGYRWRCDRAGTNETMAGKIGEALTSGQGFQRRCVVVAVPCMLPTMRGDRDEK